MAKEVDVKKSAEVVYPDFAGLERDSGLGNDMTTADLAVPYLSILQPLSKVVVDETVKGAKAGLYFNNVTMEHAESIDVIPVDYKRLYIEWVPRDEGGGMVDKYPVDDPFVKEALEGTPGWGKIQLENGHDLVETAEHYVVQIMDDGSLQPAILPMHSTGLKKNKRWNSLIMQQLIPGTHKQAMRWLYPFRLTTVKEKNDAGTWFNFDINRIGPETVTEEQYVFCRNFFEQCSEGLVSGKETNNEETPF